jgi:hypothetical protein
VTWLVACGLKREATLIARAGVSVVVGGGDAGRLERALEAQAGSATAIISSGVAGALDPALRVGDVVVDGDVELISALHSRTSGRVIGRDAMAPSPVDKRALRDMSGAVAVDMESHVAERVARRHGLRFAAIRVISDTADEALPPAAQVGMRPDGGVALGAILASLARHPGQLPALIRTGRNAGVAFRVLGDVWRDVAR